MKIKYFTLLLVLSITACKTVNKTNIGVTDIESKKATGVKLSSGELHRIIDFPSKFIIPRNVDIWLPENYSKDKKYAVLYVHDGQMLFDGTKTWNKLEWGFDELIPKLITENKIKNTIVVGIWNVEKLRYTDYYPKKPFDLLTQKSRDSLLVSFKKQRKYAYKERFNSDGYLKFIVTELKPYVDKQYPTKAGVDNTAIMGSSMGGLISMYAICEYPEVFGAAACLSTHWIGTCSNENNPIPATFLAYMDDNLPSSKNHVLYFDYGTKALDAMYLPYQDKFTTLLKKHGYTTNLKFEGGEHSEKSWRKRLETPLIFLLKKE